VRKQTSTDEAATVGVKFSPEELQQLDSWISERDEISRPEAIRRLVRSAIAMDTEWEAAKQAAISDRTPLRDQSAPETND
jgi:metal-responsive CopG/Arc/MetJ family transcriptional regulator